MYTGNIYIYIRKALMLTCTYQYLYKVTCRIGFTMYEWFFVIMKFFDMILRKGVTTPVQCTSLVHLYVYSCVSEYTLRTGCNPTLLCTTHRV